MEIYSLALESYGLELKDLRLKDLQLSDGECEHASLPVEPDNQSLGIQSISAIVIQETDVPLTEVSLAGVSLEVGQNAVPASSASEGKWQDWKIFGTTFITIFLAELGDKTQVSTLLMTAESHAPWVVFTGAAAALITTSLLGVLVGRWLSTCCTPKTLDRAAGIMLAFISIWLFWDVLHP